MSLPQELLRVRRRKDKITVIYAGLKELSLAKTLNSVYMEHKGKTRGELKEALTDCEMLLRSMRSSSMTLGTDYGCYKNI